MAWFKRKQKQRKGPASLRRAFVTPEGVDLQLELGSAGMRAAAFMVDILLIVVIVIAVYIVCLILFSASNSVLFRIIWDLGFFALFNGWFIVFEMGARGATPGKRTMGLRVVARDGARLTGGAVVARNAIRNIEYVFPIIFLIEALIVSLAGRLAGESVDGIIVILLMVWTGIFLFFPLFNRDRLRIGDLLAGTWVVRSGVTKLGADLVAPVERQRRIFPEAALDLYGVYELQTLEDVLRSGREDAIATVAWSIRNKAGLPDDGRDYEFLSDYYAALCVRLERGLMVGRRRENKHAGAAR